MVDQKELRRLIAEIYRETQAKDPIVAFQRAVHAVRKRYGITPSRAMLWVRNNLPK